MKKIKYTIFPDIQVIMDYSNYNLNTAKKEAYNGEYEIYDDGQSEPSESPTQLDVIEAQVTYTAMMTDTLLETETEES